MYCRKVCAYFVEEVGVVRDKGWGTGGEGMGDGVMLNECGRVLERGLMSVI